MRRWTTISLATLSLSGCGEPTAGRLYAELVKTYSAATALHSEATLTLSVLPADDRRPPRRVRIVTDYQAPNRLRAESYLAPDDLDSLVVSDGQFVWQRVVEADGGGVIRAAAPEALSGLLGESGPVLPGTLPGLDIVGELRLLSGTAPEPDALTLTLGDDLEEIGGQRCRMVTVRSDDAPEHRLAIGDDGLLHRVTVSLEQPGAPGRMQIVWEAAQVELNGAIAANRFAYQPPASVRVVEGATLAAALDKLTYRLDSPLPKVTLKRLAGGSLELGSLVGKPILIDFWATWCGPCAAQQPVLQELHEQYGDRVQMLMVSTEPAAKVAPVVKQRGLTLTQLLDPDQAAHRAFRVDSFPTTFLIDAQGILRHVHVGFDPAGSAARLREELDGLLTTPAAP